MQVKRISALYPSSKVFCWSSLSQRSLCQVKVCFPFPRVVCLPFLKGFFVEIVCPFLKGTCPGQSVFPFSKGIFSTLFFSALCWPFPFLKGAYWYHSKSTALHSGGHHVLCSLVCSTTGEPPALSWWGRFEGQPYELPAADLHHHQTSPWLPTLKPMLALLFCPWRSFVNSLCRSLKISYLSRWSSTSLCLLA